MSPRNILFPIIVAAFIFITVSVRADSPLPPPQMHTVHSANQEFLAVSDPSSGTRILESHSRRELWSIPQWFRWMFISNNGACLVTGHNGLNLIPVDYTENTVLASFWHKGNIIREISVKDVFTSSAKPTRTVSHYHWGTIEGFTDEGELSIRRNDDKVVLFPSCEKMLTSP